MREENAPRRITRVQMMDEIRMEYYSVAEIDSCIDDEILWALGRIFILAE